MAIPPNNINNAYATDSFLPPNPAMSKLESAPEDVVRAILLALCQDPAQERKAMQYYAKLNALKSKTLAPVVNNAGASAGSKTNPVVISDGGDEKSRYESYSKGKEGNKRKAASEVRICTRCKEAFSEDENHLEACLYHPGLFSPLSPVSFAPFLQSLLYSSYQSHYSSSPFNTTLLQVT